MRTLLQWIARHRRRMGLVALLAVVVKGGLAHTASGSTRAQEPVQSFATALAVDPATGDAFVTSGVFSARTGGAMARGHLLVYETRRRLHLIRNVTVGYGPAQVVLDTRTGRVLILNTGGGDKYAGFTGGSVTLLDLRALEDPTGMRPLHAHVTSLGRQLPRVLAIDAVTGRTFVATWALPATGVFTQTPRGQVSVLDTRTGARVRTVAGAGVVDAVAVDERVGRAFVLSTTPTGGTLIQAVDARTGQVMQTIRGGQGSGPVAVDSRTGHLFLTAERTMDILATRTGRQVGTVAIGSGAVAVVVDEARDHVFVASAAWELAGPPPGMLRMLDARRGRVLATIPVHMAISYTQILLGGTPQTLAVNAASGAIYVAGSAGPGTSGGATQGSVTAVAIQGGHLQRQGVTALPGLPIALALDPSGDHIVVISLQTTPQGAWRSRLSLIDTRAGVLLSSAAPPG